jgi:predicted O-methyltransferase YrrM
MNSPYSQMSLPEGWTTPELEQQLRLHSSAATRILEIGSFVGRSTCVIAQVLRSRTTRVPFETCDLHFDTAKEFQDFYSQIYDDGRPPITVPELHQKYLGTSQSALQQNLSSRGLSDLVTCRTGCFVDLKLDSQLSSPTYDLIHCDVAHDIAEINHNFPQIRDLLAPTGSVLICGNIATQDQINAILTHIPMKSYQRFGQTFVGYPASPPPPTPLAPTKLTSLASLASLSPSSSPPSPKTPHHSPSSSHRSRSHHRSRHHHRHRHHDRSHSHHHDHDHDHDHKEVISHIEIDVNRLLCPKEKRHAR